MTLYVCMYIYKYIYYIYHLSTVRADTCIFVVQINKDRMDYAWYKQIKYL